MWLRYGRRWWRWKRVRGSGGVKGVELVVPAHPPVSKGDDFEQLFTHTLQCGVPGQLDVEETSVGVRQQVVLIDMRGSGSSVGARHGCLDEHTNARVGSETGIR